MIKVLLQKPGSSFIPILDVNPKSLNLTFSENLTNPAGYRCIEVFDIADWSLSLFLTSHQIMGYRGVVL